MIPLDSPQWQELRDAYGPATSIPSTVKRIAAGDASVMELYDAFALIDRGAATDGALAVVPHVWAIAAMLPAAERRDLLAFIGRVAYATDNPGSERTAFETTAAAACSDLGTCSDDEALELILAVVAIKGCPVSYDAIEAIRTGELQVRCPADECGVEISMQGWTAFVDEDETPIGAVQLPAFDPAAPWTDRDAIGRVCCLLDHSGHRALGKRVASIAGSVTCPHLWWGVHRARRTDRPDRLLNRAALPTSVIGRLPSERCACETSRLHIR
jgi:hypothetical protein